MEPGQEITVISRNFDGTLRRRWKARLVDQNGSLVELVGEFDFDLVHQDLGTIQRGTVSFEYYWLDRWYNVFRFHEPWGGLRNYYCNINLPPTFESDVLDYIDLDIDLLVDDQRSIKILDLEEFEESARLLSIPETVCTSARNAVDELIGLVENRRFPFDRY